METKHTPGPWKWGGHYAAMTGGNGEEVFTTEPYEGMWLSYGDSQDANARLVAAAPELLEALATFVEICDSAPPIELVQRIGDLVSPARAAIAKATGED